MSDLMRTVLERAKKLEEQPKFVPGDAVRQFLIDKERYEAGNNPLAKLIRELKALK